MSPECEDLIARMLTPDHAAVSVHSMHSAAAAAQQLCRA